MSAWVGGWVGGGSYQSTPHTSVERAERGRFPIVVDGVEVHLEELVGLA